MKKLEERELRLVEKEKQAEMDKIREKERATIDKEREDKNREVMGKFLDDWSKGLQTSLESKLVQTLKTQSEQEMVRSVRFRFS